MCSRGELQELMAFAEKHSSSGHSMQKWVNTTSDTYKMTGMHLAAEHNHASTLRWLLLECKGDHTLPTVRGNTPLHIAARQGSVDCVRVLVRHSNTEMWARVRLLWIALRVPNDGCTLRLTPDVTRLLTSYLMRDSLATNKYVLTHNSEGKSALSLAMSNSQRDVVPLLLHSTTLNSLNDSPLGTPLHVAAAVGMASVCRLLVRTGAFINALNQRHETPIYRACCAYPEAEETVAALLQLGADWDVRANSGASPRDEAAARGYVKTVALLDAAAKGSH